MTQYIGLKGTDGKIIGDVTDVNPLPTKLTGSVVENDRVKVDVGGATINATIGDQKSATLDHTFHSAAVTPDNGSVFSVGAFKSMTISISGTSTSRTLVFEEGDADGNYYAIQGVRRSDFAMGTQTTGKNEVWEFSITGATTFRVRLTTVSGGDVTVKGKAVA